jgi:phosphonate transport system permease protein
MTDTAIDDRPDSLVVTSIATWEAAGGRRPNRSKPVGLWTRRLWLGAAAMLVGWAFWATGLGRRSLVNPRGWPQVRSFLAASVRPDLSRPFLKIVVDATITTIGYALLGSLLALVIGLVGGLFMSELWWRRSRHLSGRPRPIWFFIRSLAVVPRGIHEAVWALALVAILGRDPLVGVLAIGIPFGFITAKVVAEMIDESAVRPYNALRQAGSERLPAFGYGVIPVVASDVVSYAFYRFECAIRSSVVLGVIGAGGLGFQFAVSFQAVRSKEIWTLIYTVILLAAAIDWWGARLRATPSRRRIVLSSTAALALSILSIVHLGVSLGRATSTRTQKLAARFLHESWPPRLPVGGWHTLQQAALDTLQLSVVAISTAAVLAIPLGYLGSRRTTETKARRAVGWFTRLALLVLRAVPPPIWALIFLFVMLPGPLPGGFALGCYTVGVLGRLNASVMENVDRRPGQALRRLGASRAAVFSYADAPLAMPRVVALSLYRWEVTIRETVIVGLVGAGGLGRLLGQQQAAFDRGGIVTTVAAMIVLSFGIDLVSSRLRRDLR